MKKINLLLISFFLLAIIVSCGGGNTFEGLSDKNSNEANTIDLNKALDDKRYDFIINELEDKNLNRDKKIILAKAYLGKGGIDFIELLRNIGNYNNDTYSSFAAMFQTEKFTNEQIEESKNYFNKTYDLLDFININKSSSDLYLNKAISIPSLFNCSLKDKDFILISSIAASADALLSVVKIVDKTVKEDESDDNSNDDSNDDSDNSSNKEEFISIVKDNLTERLTQYIEEKYPDLTKEELANKLIQELDEKISDTQIQKLEFIGQMLICGGEVLIENKDFEELKNKFDEFVEQISDSNGEITKESVATYITEKIAEINED